MSHLLLMVAILVDLIGPPIAFGQTIPLREGLTIVDSYENKNGDFETIITVRSATTRNITLGASTDEAADNCTKGNGPDRQSWGTRIVSREDLESSQAFKQEWSACPSNPETDPGMTAIGVSARVLQALRGQGETGLTTDTSRMGMVRGTLTRLESGQVSIKVVVNNRPEILASVHARWHSAVGDREYWILDDMDNPLILRATYMGRPIQQVVKISFPDNQLASVQVQHDLQNDGRVALYGLYFDSGSDRLREESAAVLSDIARVLEKNTSWSLLIEGHTDNVGSEATNADLSRRRAIAVREALVKRYHIAASRLKVAGFGASRPRDTNETLEGRAINRRVELVREKG